MEPLTKPAENSLLHVCRNKTRTATIVIPAKAGIHVKGNVCFLISPVERMTFVLRSIGRWKCRELPARRDCSPCRLRGWGDGEPSVGLVYDRAVERVLADLQLELREQSFVRKGELLARLEDFAVDLDRARDARA